MHARSNCWRSRACQRPRWRSWCAVLLCIAAAADVKQVSAHASWCAVQLDAAKKLCPSYGFRSANECAAQVLPLVDGTCS